MKSSTCIRLGLTLLVCFGLPATASAGWPVSGGGTQDDGGAQILVAPSGNVYEAGSFRGVATFGTAELNSEGSSDVYVVKYSDDGVVEWAVNAGGTSVDEVTGIVLDDAENVYVTGVYHSTVYFTSSGFGGPGTLELDAHDAYSDVFVAQLAPDGVWQWARRAEGDYADRSSSIGFHPGNDAVTPPVPASLFVGGHYTCNIAMRDEDNHVVNSLDNGQCEPNSEYVDSFVARIDTDGNWMWATDHGNGAVGSDRVDTLVVNPQGEVFAAGPYVETTSIPLAGDAGWILLTDPGQTHSGARSYHIDEPGHVTDRRLNLTTTFNPDSLSNPVLEFWHYYDTERRYDGGVLEASPDGSTWYPVSNAWMIANGYPSSLSTCCANPLPGREAWNGYSGGWIRTRVNVNWGPGNWRVRWRFGTDWSVSRHGWWIDDIRLYDDGGTIFSIDLEGTEQSYVARLERTLDPDPGANPPFWSWRTLTPDTISFEDSILTDGGDVILTGATTAATTLEAGVAVPTAGAAVAAYRPTGSGADWLAAAGATGGVGSGVTLDEEGSVYLTGTFSGTEDFGSTPLTSAGGTDVFAAKLDSGLFWQWAKSAGGSADDTGADVGTSGEIITVDGNPQVANLFVTGSFRGQAAFGTDDCGASPQQCLNSTGGSDAYVANLVSEEWSTLEGWLAGDRIMPPDGAYVETPASVPEFYVQGSLVDAIGQGYVLWYHNGVSGYEGKLYALQPIPEIEIRWHVDPDPINLDRIPQLGSIQWPSRECQPQDDGSCFQTHVTGAPVELEPAVGGYTYFILISPSTDSSLAEVDESKIFRASRPGYAVVLYTEDASGEVATEVVKSFSYDQAPEFQGDKPWTIGTALADVDHEEIGRAGYVLNPTAFFDPSLYDRDARTGPIFPVNRVSPFRPQDATKHMVVVWYRKNIKNVFWGVKPVHYDCSWPANPEKIIIASQQGAEVLGQDPMDPLVYLSKQLYNQPDPALAGYNPNDEHAIFAPSNTGTGMEALFALRSDFGGKLNDDLSAASDPYSLVKYRDADTLEWRFRIYQVLATGAGYESFRFTGTAGTTVTPPYPVLLLPGCAETTILGEQPGDPQPPAPFFRDYANVLWSKSAGDGAIQFHYPLQPTFHYDLDNNDQVDAAEGQCVPWLARLPESQGGSPNSDDPIRVFYSISWPTDVPLLQVGETLLKPKRGLPEIYNQAAVRVVFDQLYEESLADGDYDPANRLVRLMDPLNERRLTFDPGDPPSPEAPDVCYGLEGLPADIATETDLTGQKVLLSSLDGVTKLPYVVRSRLRYDPLNSKLKFKGSFDDSGAGEPLLLLNVMTQPERDLLKDISGNSNWDACIDKMYHLSRNPNQLDLSRPDSCIVECVEFNIMGIEFKICFPAQCGVPDGVMDHELLVGFQDSNTDGIPEPVEGVGPGHAVTAGFAQGNGYVTLVFNDDPSLSPLPVSLNIFKVGCLRFPEDEEPPELLSTYMGELKVIQSDNIFDEQLTLRHSGDFAGQSDDIEFEWYFHPDEDGTPPTPLPDPDGGQMHGWLKFPVDDPYGANEITIGGANILALSDNWFVARYRGLPACNNASEWSVWAGQPGSTPLEPRAQLAEGWVKRVVRGLNPFEARVQEFHKSPTNTYASMIMQLGQRYEGDIALSPDPDNLNEIGLIEAYETVLRRAMNLSVNSTPPVDYDPANSAILNVASRIVDFYALLGNEGYADAQDPMVGLRTNDAVFGLGSLAPTIFTFENQLGSLLEEELVLLRGRDDSQGPVAARPVYNRLFWNFTSGNGEIAYALSYNIYDVYLDGVLDEKDAKLQYPMGHGDTWGHFLTATKKYYDLLRHPFFTWNPRPEAVLVAGVPIQVDYLDERKFAKTAATKAKVGADLVDLTYRSAYVENPEGQWQGYKDTDADRAWGLAEWGKRAGMGAYLDWVVGNAILPAEDPDPTHVGIQRIDRQHNDDLYEIITAYQSIQAKVDTSDRGLNPLGLAKGVVPFDIDPTQVDDGVTHFEQIYERATKALDNVVSVWDFANQLNKMLRFNQDTVEDITRNSRSTEFDYRNQLIEIFGYPYDGDELYPSDYDGPDLYHYMYVDPPVLEGTVLDIDVDDPDSNMDPVQPTKIINAVYNPMPAGVGFFDLVGEDVGLNCGQWPFASNCSLGDPGDQVLQVEYPVWESLDAGISFPKKSTWGNRRATGKLQDALNDILQAEIALKKGLRQYNNHALDIKDMVDTMAVTYNIREEQISIQNWARTETQIMSSVIETTKIAGVAAKRTADGLRRTFSASEECVPDSFIVGMAGGGDTFAAVSCTLKASESVVPFVFDILGDVADTAVSLMEAAKEDIGQQAAIEVDVQGYRLEMFNLKGQLDHMLREEPVLRAEVFSLAEAAKQAQRQYYQVLAEGQRTLAGLIGFRRNSASAIQEYRYEDMAYRIFRNEALSKYRSTFDVAARYAYLAAAAYDYETNLLGTDSAAGQEFLTDIVRERSVGQILEGEPVPGGSPGLADPMARMEQNFEVLKGQMGFNNPQTETNRFSLRRELFRIPEEDDSDEAWREVLRRYRVDDLWTVKEFRRYCRPFAPESAGPQPGLVIPLSTTVTFGLNFFGWPLGPGDSAYDPTHFATRVRGVGTWFQDYADLPLSNTPRVYLVPVGADVLRSPSADDFKTREWTVVDQVLPVPFPIGAGDLDDEAWLPLEDMLSGPFGDIRRFSSFRAHHYSEPFDASEIISDSRLIGRSVWNTEWLLIIPGGTLLYDPTEGLDTFIEGQEIPGGNGERDGNGVGDVKLFFQTYSYSGN
ncbi:MAG: hypothetical protein V2I67_01980 [Thermoanaerobaculales bacterium]|nr:hypothetical protein [Thermoanaerobaculales bacterium]